MERSAICIVDTLSQAEHAVQELRHAGFSTDHISVLFPDKQGTREIYRIYLTDDLPYDGVLAKEADGMGASIERLIERFVDWQFARRDENRFLEVTLRSALPAASSDACPRPVTTCTACGAHP